MALQPSKLIFHNVRGSNRCARVRMAAALKTIPLQNVELGGGMRTIFEDPQYHAKKPKWKLPILEAHYENGEHLIMTQSLSMLEFLEETYPGEIRLIPPVSEMAARAKVPDLALLVGCDLEPLLSQ